MVGRENFIGLSGPVILAPNHTSELDVTALPMVLPFFSHLRPIYFVMNTREKFTSGNLGWRGYFYGCGFLKLLGGIIINPGHKDYSVSLKNHIKLLKEGHTLCIFPEGKCTKNGCVGEAHGGLGYLVYATGATVVPIAINTFFNMSWRDFLLRRRKVTITISEPIMADRIISPEIKSLMAEDFRYASQIVLDRSKEIMGL